MQEVSRIIRLPPLGRVRLASVDDASHIFDLINDSMSWNFRVHGTPEIVYLIENCVLSICQLDTADDIIGFLAIRDYPLIPSVHPRAWEGYIWTKFKAVELNTRNTLFIHLVCWDTMYSREVIDNLLKSVFMHDPYVHYIAMVKSVGKFPLLIPGQSRAESSFRRVSAVEKGMPADKLPTLCIAERKEVSPRLRIRRAVEEDNDDIVPILEEHSQRLRELYGEFYISELVSRHPESERVLLVCEHKEVAVGVMCLNTDINFEALEESFELSPFSGLRKLNAAPKKRSKEADSANPSMTFSALKEPLGTSTIFNGATKQGRVTWTFNEDAFKDVLQPPEELHSFPVTSPAQLDILQILEEDEEEMEFDIVNIDTNLLRVPEMLTYESFDMGPIDSIKKILSTSRKDLAEEKKPKPKAYVSRPSVADKTPEPTRYSGTSNAFLLEVFAMHRDYDERYGFDMLEVAYEVFPDRDYCIICFPSSCSSFPLLEHFTLVTPYSTRNRFINETLYVAHVNSVRGNLRVRQGEAYDMDAMHDICEHSPQAQTIMDLYESALKSCSLECYALLSQNQPVGMVVLGPLEEGTTIRTQYELESEPRRPGTDGMILEVHCWTNPFRALIKPVGSSLHSARSCGPKIVCPPCGRTSYAALAGTWSPLENLAAPSIIMLCDVLTGIVSPCFEPHYRWFMRELLRNSRYSTLFWISRLFARGDSNPLRNLISIAAHMMPVHPRRAIPNISANKDLDKIYKDISVPFALWVLERPLTSLPKVYVNSSIVVVGASRTGLAFLETLLLGPTCQYLTFSNVTLVSEHGLPTVSECLRAADTCVPRDGRYTDRYLKSVPFYFYLDVMTAVMVGIDRKKKCIHLKGGGVKFYDELVLTCGRQFQHPDYLHTALQLVKEIEQGKPCDRLLMDNPNYKPEQVPLPSELPENVMLINSLYEANISLKRLMHMITEASEDHSFLATILLYYNFAEDLPGCLSPENQIIVYGDCIESYSCIAALLELGLFADMITFIEPFPPDDPTKCRVNCFNNETIDNAVQASLEKLGIRVYRRYYLTGWQLEANHVDSINLMSQLHFTVVPCFAMFYYGLKAIDVHAFRAINECGLVYDGGLVVDTSFETNDPNVYGAGTCVKYSRKLYATPHAHQHYCSEDVGEALAKLFLKRLDPFVIGNECEPLELAPRYSSTILTHRGSQMNVGGDFIRLSMVSTRMPQRWRPVMKFESPMMQSATLPGPLYYMKVRKPGIEIPMEVQKCLPHQGHSLITDKNGNYFHLKLNVLHCVDAVTCLSKKQFSCELLSQLYGKHEAFFNKLLVRFKKGMISDLFEFFTQPWLSALYQETFQELLSDINDQDVSTVNDLLKSKFKVCDENEFENKKGNLTTESSGSLSDSSQEQMHHVGTFRSIINKFVNRDIVDELSSKNLVPGDVPSECGQSAAVRGEAANFWRSIDGERIVATHLDRYLNKTSVVNSHYAVPDAEFI